MKIVESESIRVITVIVLEICKQDKLCVSNKKFDLKKILNESKSFKKYITEKKIQDFKDYKSILKILKKELKAQKSTHFEIIDTINAIQQYLKTKDREKWNKVLAAYYKLKQKAVDIFKLRLGYSKEKISSIVNILRNIVKVIRKSKSKYPEEYDFCLDIQEARDLHAKNSDLYHKYAVTFNSFLNIVKNLIQTIILEKNKQKLDVVTLSKELETKYNVPPLFNNNLNKHLFIDLSFNFYTVNNRKLSCSLPLYRVQIQYNKQYDVKNDTNYFLKFKVIGANVWQFCYSEKYKKQILSDKYSKVNKLIENLDRYRQTWLTDIRSSKQKIKEAGLALEIIYHTGMRVGTEGNVTQGIPTYGLLTLLVQHVRCSNDKVEFIYVGKSGIKQHYSLKEKIIVKEICKMIKNKNKKDRLFTITPEELNIYIKKRLNIETTVHKFRTLKGTKIAYDLLIKNSPCSKFKTDKEKLNYLEDSLKKVGEALGHYNNGKVTGSTALNNYVDPIIIKEYFTNCNLQITKKYKKVISLVEVEYLDGAIKDDYPGWPGYYNATPVLKKLTYYTKRF